MRNLLYLLILCFAAYVVYHRLAPRGAEPAVVATAEVPAVDPATEVPLDPQTGKPMARCPRCQGEGTTKCTARGCVNGWVDCPGPCLKLSVGRWEHLDVPGHDPKELWRKFTYDGGWTGWTTAHIGEVIETRNGVPTNIGKCSVCGGKGKVPCQVCHGTGRVVCAVCGGKKYLRASLVTTPAPALPPRYTAKAVATAAPVRSASAAIKLKDGTTLRGRIVVTDTDAVWVRKEDGQTVQIPLKDIVSPVSPDR